jgi:hypothetical protein
MAARLCAVVWVLLAAGSAAMAQRMAPAFFILGDSLADPGNNNYLRTLSRADALPNGIDFPGRKATGRYCNGRTATDIIGTYLPRLHLHVHIQIYPHGANIWNAIEHKS